MRLLTFQSQEVIKKILLDGTYFADGSFCRENRDYQADINQLNGFQPIWCFASTKERDFVYDDFVDGSLLERFRCEMSLDQEVGLTQFLLLELEVDDSIPLTGLTHNAYIGAKVIPYISKKQLLAVYRVTNTTHWYYKNIRLLESYGREDILFPQGLRTMKRKMVNGVEYEVYTLGLIANSKIQHYTNIAGNMVPVTITKVSYSGDFYTVILNGKEIEVETVYVKCNN